MDAELQLSLASRVTEYDIDVPQHSAISHKKAEICNKCLNIYIYLDERNSASFLIDRETSVQEVNVQPIPLIVSVGGAAVPALLPSCVSA